MKRLLITLIVACATFFMHSCNIHITGRLMDYERISTADKALVKFYPGDAGALENDGNVYAITATQLSAALKNSPKALVYTWSPNCHAASCILVSACQKICSERGYELFVVADYYDMEAMKGQNRALRPLFIADHKHYGINKSDALKKRFMKDVIADANWEKQLAKNYYRFYYFENGKLQQIVQKLSDIRESFAMRN